MKMNSIKILALFSVLLMLSCGGKEGKKKEGFSYEKSTKQETNTMEVDSNIVDIVITGNDLMQFNTKEIKVKAGQKVKLTLRHIGVQDINVMGHNFVVLKQGVDLIAFATKAAIERDNKYIPKDSQDIIAHTDLVGGGQAITIEFDAPTPGSYEFLCSFPGHYAMMRGLFIVE